ncbi:MAG TPA: hypothetical protein VNT23_05185, partial [Gaiellaceae bacterium]|nr:hypothetical protein [Gaiellaceae bacterium]
AGTARARARRRPPRRPGRAAAESPLWAEALRPDPDGEGVFGALVPEQYRLGLETIYEGYLVHYGRPRLFAPADDDVALLLGDYLYAHGLVRIAATGDLGAVETLAELISACAALRAEGAGGDGEEWLRAARRLGGGANGLAAAERALAAHARRLS